MVLTFWQLKKIIKETECYAIILFIYQIYCMCTCVTNKCLNKRFVTERDQCPWRLQLWFLCTALLLNEIYLPMKIHVMLMPCIVLKLCFGQKRADGCPNRMMDRRVDYYMPPFGGIKRTYKDLQIVVLKLYN